MLKHADIIEAAGGHHGVARAVLPHVDTDEITLQKRVRAWARSGSIPGEYWALLARLGFATMDELATAAAERKGVTVPANDVTSQEEAA